MATGTRTSKVSTPCVTTGVFLALLYSTPLAFSIFSNCAWVACRPTLKTVTYFRQAHPSICR